ncbi:hypothetical protein [Fluviicola sp.]|uniref:hypothetical protein n=1 Tax=Fluviicola sp. TaxID=1917219 RepID=UPI003D28C910
MEQENTTSGISPNLYNQNSNVATQKIVNNYFSTKTEKVDIEGAREINPKLKKIIDKVKRQASPPLTDVIDFRDELRERFERNIQLVPTKHLRFRKNNGRIIADVESYEQEYNIKLDEESNQTQEILRSFLLNNDKERNEELKRLLTHKGQQRPAIITCDGFLINGNRRKMILEELFRIYNQDPRFESMRVIILPEGVSELEIQQIENRYQLQNEGKSEYQGLNRAIKYKRNIENGFSLEAQLKDDPNYHELPPSEFKKVVLAFEKNFLNPLVCIDRYLGGLNRKGMYNTITESINDREGRWQAFVDYSNFYNGTLASKSKLAQLKIKESEVGKLETAIFKIIRKRSLSSRSGDSPVGKLHEFIRKLPKYLSNTEAAINILKIANISDEISQELKQDKQGNKSSEREIDSRWGALHETEILSNLFQAQRHLNNQENRDKPLELLEDALKKLNHNNLKIENMGSEYFEHGLELTQMISVKADEIYKAIDHARYNFKQSEKKGK